MPHELLERVLPERAHSPTGGYEQDCFDSALGFDLHIAVTWESSVVFEEQARSVVRVGVAGIDWEVNRARTRVVRVAKCEVGTAEGSNLRG